MGWGRWSRSSLLVLALLGPFVPGRGEAQPAADARWLNLGTSGATCTLRSGSGAPSSGLGAVCDVYHQTDSPYTVYVKTGGSTWTAVVQMPSSAAAGDLITAASATVSGRIAAVAVGQVLASNGTSTPPVFTSAPSLTQIGGASNLTLNPTGDLVFNPTGNDLLPTTNYDLNIGALTLKYLTLHAAELWVETLVAQNTIATIGGRILVGPTTTLTSDLSSGATSIAVKHNQMANGDRVLLQENGALEWMAITSGASGSGPYTYSVTRNLDGTGANAWPAGAAVFNTGTTGDGLIDLYSVNGIMAGSTAGPTICGDVRTGTIYSDLDHRWCIGNLNGTYGYGADTYGAAFGDNANAWVKIDPTNGVRIGENATTYFQVDPAGNATFAGQVTVGMGGRNQLSNTEFFRGRATGRTSANSGALAAVDGTEWGGFFDESTSLTWAQGTSAAGGVCIGTNYMPWGGGAACFAAAGTPNNNEYFRAWGPHLPVTAGQRVEFSYYALPYRSRVRPRVLFYGDTDADGDLDYISESDGDVASSGYLGPTSTSTVQNRDIANWSRAWGIYTVPAQAEIAVPTILGSWGTGDGADPFVFYTRPYFGIAQAGQTTPSPWQPGGSTLITGDHLTTDMVISNTIRSSGATALGTGTGFWLDATGTPTFRVGNPSGNQLKWDGTNLTVGQGTVTIDSSGVSVAANAGGLTYATANAYRFSGMTSTDTGLAAATLTNNRSLYNHIEYSGAHNASMTVQNRIYASYAPSSGGGTLAFAEINMTAATGASGIALDADAITLSGVPNFEGGTSGSAGSSAGYLNVLVGGVSYRIQVFNP